MNPILHDLENKQWIWTAAQTPQASVENTRLKTGYKALDNALSGGFPKAGMIHVSSHLGCGELRLMLNILREQAGAQSNKMWAFIAPPFALNAEFLLAENIPLEHLVLIQADSTKDALWSAEQCAKSGICEGVFLWQQDLTHAQIRKLELAALHGASHCFWFDTSSHKRANLPLTLSLSLQREDEQLKVRINKQKVGWPKPAVTIKLAFKSKTGRIFRPKPHNSDNVVHLRGFS
jgi:cell division inhibitor SulA